MARKVPRDAASEWGDEEEEAENSGNNRPSRLPIFLLIGALVIVFIFLGVVVYFSISSTSIPSINPWIIAVIVFIVLAAVIFELVMKPNKYVWGRTLERVAEEEMDAEERRKMKEQGAVAETQEGGEGGAESPGDKPHARSGGS